MRRIDNSSLAAFRVLFGALMLFSTLRFMLKGWVYDFYIKPAAFFPFEGFSWIHPWPEWGMYLHFALLALFALLVTLGLYYRVAILGFFLGFTFVELIDKTNYLNHYYFISILSFLMIFLPLHRRFSLDVLRKPGLYLDRCHPWPLWVLRLQVGLVYFFAGVAKLNSDWLFEAQPLKIWLAGRTDFPILGPLFAYPETAYVMSWLGMIFDLTAPFLLSCRRSRPWMYSAVVVFHLLTYRLFNIGVFPWVMIFAALIFFPPDWPQKLAARLHLQFPVRHRVSASPANSGGRPGKVLVGVLVVFFLVQLFLPLRHWFYPGSVLWSEEGFRFSWRVMLMEKSGSVDFLVHDPRTGRDWVEVPRKYYESLQVKQMSTQPDMILQAAHHIRDEFARAGIPGVEVRAQSKVSLNGRIGQALIDPGVDLARVQWTWKPAEYIPALKDSPFP